ncbi:unnamed protein product [Allacma fusca]|uniref:Anion exchange protein n=1 Tax=Allacma fusca TaxID=39272 RepID=A0A8J2LKQ6_9HEXA|nr:unnamed protein product [Allacma fusca]
MFFQHPVNLVVFGFCSNLCNNFKGGQKLLSAVWARKLLELPTVSFYKIGISAEASRPTTPISIACSAPPDLSGSPIKKVQFEVGGGDDDSLTGRGLDRMPMQPQLAVGNSTGDGFTITTPTKTRADTRDYLLQPSATVTLLPSIAEEKNGRGSFLPTFGRSVSVDPSGKTQGTYPGPDMTRPQEVFGFVQLDALMGEGDVSQREWKEIARWIKYEEDLEEGADRWGRPHIASLSFHSLIKLRQLIEKDGIIMLDLEEKDMPGVAYRIVEDLSSKGLIRSDESPLLMRALLLKHKHVQEMERSWFGLRRTNTSAVSLQSLFDDKSRVRSSGYPADSSALVRRNSAMQKHVMEMTNSTRSLQRTASGNVLKPMGELATVQGKPFSDQYFPSEEDLKWIQRKENIKRLLPHGAEATLVMVGDFDTVKKPIFVFIRLAEPSLMFNVTEVPVPVRFFAILLVPPTMEIDLIEIGRSIGALMSNKHFYEIALLANGRKNLMIGINEFLDDSIVLPPGDWDNHDLLPLHVLQSKSKAIKLRRLKKQQSFVASNESFCDGVGLVMNNLDNQISKESKDIQSPFQRTGRLFGGLINDVKRRYRHYKSDFVDCLNFQCFATTAFMYFASIAQVITFAGLMGEKTKNLIGMSETLIATASAGVIFALVSGQPLIPVGPTGPLLVFDEILYALCNRHDIEFLPARTWISIWLFIIVLLVVCFEGSVLVKWFTRFTQDIFAVLTSVLLIFESIDNLVEIYENHPLTSDVTPPASLNLSSSTLDGGMIPDETENLTRQPNTALLCTILMLGTFFVAYFLREFRNSIFLGEKARRALGDFGVPIAILTMVFLDYCATDTYTEKMKVPEGLQPSNPDARDWVISPMGTEDKPFSMYIAVGCVLPAMLIFILIFMTTEICELIVNTKERKLVKGSGFHLDILLMSMINLGCGFLGAPWLCCATLRALAHVTALTVYSQNNPPGEKPSIVEVKEQRVTALSVSLLIGCSVLMAPLLVFIPLAVLFGVFMYMGVSSLSTTQLFDRVSLLFVPVKSHPQVPFVRRVKTWKMHMYTMIQLGCLGILWAVKSIRVAALAFPFILMLLVPIRIQLKHLFTSNELEALDGDPSKLKN